MAEMSSAGSLATGSYTAGCIAMAAQRTEVVAGLISQSRLSQVSSQYQPDSDFAGFVGSKCIFYIRYPCWQLRYCRIIYIYIFIESPWA